MNNVQHTHPLHIDRRQALCAGAVAWCALGLGATTTAAETLADDTVPAENAGDDKQPPAKYETVRLRGKVVWLDEALHRRFGIAVDPDAKQVTTALEASDGQLHPLVKDFRGRGFSKDARLRDIPLELVVRRFAGSPMIQVVSVFAIKPDGRYELDYWCDICAIPMYELKECECCQGEIRIRLRKADASR